MFGHKKMSLTSLQSRNGAAHNYWFVSYNINSCQQLFLSSVSFAFHVKCVSTTEILKSYATDFGMNFFRMLKTYFKKTYFNQNVKKLQNILDK